MSDTNTAGVGDTESVTDTQTAPNPAPAAHPDTADHPDNAAHGIIGAVFLGVCSAVAAAFPDCAVYTTAVRQGAAKPCFFISYRPPSSSETARKRFTQKRLIGNRFLIKTGICAEYHGDGNDRLQLADVSEMLFCILETVSVEGDRPVRAKQLHADIADGVLYLFADYEMFAYMAEAADVMEEAEYIQLQLDLYDDTA